MQRYVLAILSGLLVICLSGNAIANDQNQDEINQILRSDPPPFGVVFEIVEGERDALNWAIPRVKNFAEQLRGKFPDIGIAVVTHGKEEFALMTIKQEEHKAVHKTVKSLVDDKDIPVHVCGTHASWYGKKPEDFPDYVDVAPAGPAKIREYEDIGYQKVVIDKP